MGSTAAERCPLGRHFHLDMRYTLWRGDIVFGLGEFSQSPTDPRLMAGPVAHGTAMEEAGPLWQQRIPYQGGSLIHQQAIPPASTAPDSTGGAGSDSEAARVPIYASMEPATQVSTDEMLVVRDAGGKVVTTEMICVFGPPTLPAEFRSLLEPYMLEHFQQWQVMFRIAEASNDAA